MAAADHHSDASHGEGEADFGDLEMFDSNAAPTIYPSQAKVADGETRSSRKSKRDKKDKRKHRHSADDDEPTLPPLRRDESPKKHRKSKRKSSKDVDAEANLSDASPEVDTADASQSKKKRKHADTSESKKHKKRRSYSHNNDDGDDAASSGFLRRRKEKHSHGEGAIYEEEEEEEVEEPGSPAAERLRRRSLSRDARSRENSAPPVEEIQNDGKMETQEEVERQLAALARSANLETEAHAAKNVQALAQRALTEHQNGQTSRKDVEMEDNYPAEPLTELGDAAADDESRPKRTRSSRKKAKPTFYEQDPIPEDNDDGDYDEENRDAIGELPSPNAMTPSRRKRTQPAAKKQSRGRKPKRDKLSQSMRGGSDEGDDFGKSRTTWTQGRFSEEELARIAKAIEGFRDAHDMTQREVNELIHAPGGTTAGETNAQLWLRVFAECPDRHRQKVINVTRKKFHNFVARGTWTEEQDRELAEMISVHGTKWSHIASLINRHPEDLRDRYRNYIVCGANQRKDAWDEDEEARLTQYIIESMEAIDELRAQQPDRPMLKKSYEELIDWQDISERMDRTRSRLQCITKWKAMNLRTHGRDKLISNDPDSQISFRLEKARRQISSMPVVERFRLILAIHETSAFRENKIPWQRLVDKQFRNQWHRYTQQLLWHRYKQVVPNGESASVRDVAQYLVDHYNQAEDFPDISDEIFNDAQEMEFLQSIAPPPSSSQEHVTKGDASADAEFVQNSDGEVNAQANGAAAGNEFEIDPALTDSQPMAKRTPGSRKRSRKSAVANEDAVQDVDSTQEMADEADQDSDIDVEQFRKKKTPSKFKSPGKKRKGDRSQVNTTASDSGMDDMDDLPARVAVA